MTLASTASLCLSVCVSVGCSNSFLSLSLSLSPLYKCVILTAVSSPLIMHLSFSGEMFLTGFSMLASIHLIVRSVFASVFLFRVFVFLSSAHWERCVFVLLFSPRVQTPTESEDLSCPITFGDRLAHVLGGQISPI